MFSTMVESEPKEQSSQLTIGGIRTWPRAHLSQRSLSDLQYRIKLEKAIKLAKQNLDWQTAEGNSAKQECEGSAGGTYRQITRKILSVLERIRDTKNDQLLAKSGRIRRRESKTAETAAEPHFGSMILFGTLQRNESKALQRGMALMRRESILGMKGGGDGRRQSIAILSDDIPIEEGPAELLPEQLTVNFAALEEEPFFLQYLPLFTSLTFALFLLFLGALIFQLIDAEIGAQSFHRALLFAFQALCTIGWGDVRASNKWSQAICIVFTIFGVPMFFSALANVGQFISGFYTVDWLYLTCVVRPMNANEEAMLVKQHVPLRKSLYLLCIHQLIGVLLYGGLFKDYPPISVIYFCITSVATIGIGDFLPDAGNIVEAMVAIIFLAIGMILLAALMIAFSYYFQLIFFVYLRGWLLRRGNERK